MKVVDREVEHGFDAEISQSSKKLLFNFLKPSAVNKKILSTENPHVWCASFSEHKKISTNLNLFFHWKKISVQTVLFIGMIVNGRC